MLNICYLDAGSRLVKRGSLRVLGLIKAANPGLVATIRGRREAVAERLLRAPAHDLAHDAGFLEGDTRLVAQHVQVALGVLPETEHEGVAAERAVGQEEDPRVVPLVGI